MKKLLVSLIVLVFAAAPVSANMVVDGGFETPHFTGEAAMKYQYTGDTHGAWTMTCQYTTGVDIRYDTVGEVFWADIVFAEGTQLASIGESTRNNAVSQEISGFVIGIQYEIELALISYGASYLQELIIQMYDPAADAYDLDYIMVPDAVRDPSIRNDMAYQTVQFTASAVTLELIIENPYDSVNIIDDVSIVSLGPVVGTATPAALDVWEKASQGTTTETFTVVLNSSPGAGDTITVDIDPNSNGNGADVTVDLPQLTFTSATWGTPQTVTVTAIDDTLADGVIEVDYIGFTVVSTLNDSYYVGANISPVEVTIHDDDSDAIVISKTDVSLNEEGATSDTYTVVPLSPISDDVIINIGAPDPVDPNVAEPLLEVTVNGADTVQLTFTTGNWDTPQTVTVAAIDDTVGDGDPHSETIGHVAVSADSIYHLISVPDVLVTITDNDCGSWGYDPMDFNTDCYVTLIDFAEFAAAFLNCTVPYEPGCTQ